MRCFEGGHTALKGKKGELWPEDSRGGGWDAFLPRDVCLPSLPGCSQHCHPKLEAVRPAPRRGRQGENQRGCWERRGRVIRRRPRRHSETQRRWVSLGAEGEQALGGAEAGGRKHAAGELGVGVLGDRARPQPLRGLPHSPGSRRRLRVGAAPGPAGPAPPGPRPPTRPAAGPAGAGSRPRRRGAPRGRGRGRSRLPPQPPPSPGPPPGGPRPSPRPEAASRPPRLPRPTPPAGCRGYAAASGPGRSGCCRCPWRPRRPPSRPVSPPERGPGAGARPGRGRGRGRGRGGGADPGRGAGVRSGGGTRSGSGDPGPGAAWGWDADPGRGGGGRCRGARALEGGAAGRTVMQT